METNKYRNAGAGNQGPIILVINLETIKMKVASLSFPKCITLPPPPTLDYILEPILMNLTRLACKSTDTHNSENAAMDPQNVPVVYDLG